MCDENDILKIHPIGMARFKKITVKGPSLNYVTHLEVRGKPFRFAKLHDYVKLIGAKKRKEGGGGSIFIQMWVT